MRDAVIAAAVHELAVRGEHASVAGVAQRAGVHETSIYRRFGTREELFCAALLTSSEQRVPVPDTGSLRRDLVATLRMAIAGVNAPLGLALLRTGVLAPGAYTAERRRFWQARIDTFTPVFDRAIERGEIPTGVDIALALEMLIAPLHSRALATGFAIDDDLAERITDILLTGVSASAAAPSTTPEPTTTSERKNRSCHG